MNNNDFPREKQRMSYSTGTLPDDEERVFFPHKCKSHHAPYLMPYKTTPLDINYVKSITGFQRGNGENSVEDSIIKILKKYGIGNRMNINDKNGLYRKYNKYNLRFDRY